MTSFEESCAGGGRAQRTAQQAATISGAEFVFAAASCVRDGSRISLLVACVLRTDGPSPEAERAKTMRGGRPGAQTGDTGTGAGGRREGARGRGGGEGESLFLRSLRWFF